MSISCGWLRWKRFRRSTGDCVSAVVSSPANDAIAKGASTSGPGNRLLLVTRLIALAILGVLIVRIAWVSDDALITLRTALNISHGWGPGFNATESVQAYTHPLWFLLWTGIGVSTNQWIVGVIFLGVACSLGAAAIALWQAGSLARIIVITVTLGLSHAFLDYATSGLENPLAYLLCGVLFVLLASRRHDRLVVALTGASAAAMLLTRLDLALLIAPAAIIWAWSRRTRVTEVATASAAAAVPLVIWFVWSYATYGSFLPNTYEAKRNLAIPGSELFAQGLMYLWVSAQYDTATLIGLVIGLVLAGVLGSALQRAWAIGVIAYLMYVVSIGGDFMGGRFLAVPLYVCVLLIATVAIPWLQAGAAPAVREVAGSTLASVYALLLAFTVIAGVGAAVARGTDAESPRRYWDFNVADERGHYSPGRDFSTMLRATFDKYSPAPRDGDLYTLNVAAANWPNRSATEEVSFSVPKPGYCVFAGGAVMDGPLVHHIDPCGLTDRLAASIPYVPEKPHLWRMGHFLRAMPDGYWEAVSTGDPSLIPDSDVRAAVETLWAQIR